MGRTIIGITGGTASGKSTLAQQLVNKLANKRVLELGIDRFYRNQPVPSWDAPEAIDHQCLFAVIDALISGNSAETPIYDYSTHARAGYEILLPDYDILIIEGLFTLHWEQVKKRLDFSVFVDCPGDIRLARRMLRDIAERGRDVNNVVDQYLTSVRPNHAKYVEPQRHQADLIVDGQQLDQALDAILARIEAL